ncbi:MAG: penicillin-binding protein 2 [Lachnospiraceae bacterium]|nr:penicillin-binding protein 2 [Lachnospiraceae bacterium]
MGSVQNRKKRKTFKVSRDNKKKLTVIFFVIAVAFVALTVKVFYIEEVSGEQYEKQVLSQKSYDSVSLAYRRGDITDSKGTILATSTDVYSLILDCRVMLSKDKYLEPSIAALMQCYGDELDEDNIRDIISKNPNNAYIVLIKQMPYDRMKKLSDLMNDGEHSLVKGLWFEKSYIRSYPYGSLASEIIGMVQNDGVGLQGLEKFYDKDLTGINGRVYGFLNSDSDYEKNTRVARDGYTVVSTIDANLQSIVEDKIKEFLTTFQDNYNEGPAAQNIGVLMMSPQTGEVLAMADYPSFDLSNPRDLSAYYSEEEIAEMDNHEMYEALNRIWMNFCVGYTYEPGSTAKPFTVACGLDTGVLTGDEEFYCDGGENIAEYRIKCVNKYGHGMETVKKALMDSCNDALMQMSYVIGVKNFTKYQSVFGFGRKTNIDLPGESRTDSLVYTEDNMTKIDLATNSFGQNFNTTMIQLGSAFCSLINGGMYYQPHMVTKILDEEGQLIRQYQPTLLKQTISRDTSEKLKDYLYGVVSEQGGTGKYAKVAGYSMGGKTGTAQLAHRDGINYLVSFIGYVPQDDPKVMIYVVVDRPNTQDQAHSTYAQNLCREILEEALPYLNIYPDEPLNEKSLTSDVTNFLTGLSWYSDNALNATEHYSEENRIVIKDNTSEEKAGDDGQATENTQLPSENTPASTGSGTTSSDTSGTSATDSTPSVNTGTSAGDTGSSVGDTGSSSTDTGESTENTDSSEITLPDPVSPDEGEDAGENTGEAGTGETGEASDGEAVDGLPEMELELTPEEESHDITG